VKFRKKPVVVEAEQFNQAGDHQAVVHLEGEHRFAVLGKQGLVTVDLGDWIITEQDGSGFYPCKPDVFERTYEPA
jgi:hypothetical protein